MPAKGEKMDGRKRDGFKADFELYVISDSVPVLKKAVADGAGIVQLRDKSNDLNSILEKSKEIVLHKKRKSFIFILNDYPELAAGVGADGVHIGQDMSYAETRKIVGPDLIIGRSTHCLEQGRRAEAEGADYISVGPVFKTPTKPGRKAVGLEYVREAAAKIKIPRVAIGGIDLSNLDSVMKAGAKTIGVVRAAGDAAELLKKIGSNKLCA